MGQRLVCSLRIARCIMLPNQVWIVAIMLLAAALSISLSKDLERAIKWFIRSLVRVGIAVAIVALCYAALVAPR